MTHELLEAAEAESLIHIGPPFRLTHGGFSVEPSSGMPMVENEADLKRWLDHFGKALLYLKVHAGRIRYLRGDLINLAEAALGEAASQVIDPEFIGDERDANEDRRVAKGVSPDLRVKAPSFDHARVIAHLKPAQQEKYLQQALDNDWIPSKLKTEVSAEGAGGKTAVRYLLIVEVPTETRQEEWAKKLEAEGFSVTKRSSLKKDAKEKKAAKGGRKKKGEVTARKRRGAPKPYTRRRTPTGPPRS